MDKKILHRLLSLLLVLLGAWAVEAADLAAPVREGYRIGPNDVIRIQVFGEEDLTLESKVSGEGKINYPLLGMMQVEGRTLEELQQELTGRLAAGFVRLPKVSVSIVRHRNYYVGGEIKTPGGYPYEEGLTVQKALSLAGGFTEKADKQGLKVTRLTDGRIETLTIGPDDVIRPNDSLMVATQNHKVYVSGEVRTPGAYLYGEGLSVQKALAMAGGLTEKSERGEFRVLRHTNGREETLRVNLDTPVLPDDIIVVAEGQRFYISGEVKTAGRYLYEKGLSVNKALSLAGGPTERAEKGTIKVTRINEGLAQTMVVTRDAAVQPDDIIVVEPQNHKLYVSGEVRTPGAYPYGEGLSVQKALAMAGGLTEKAERGEFRVLRHTNGREETSRVTLETPVLPDDIIVVAEGQRFYISGEVRTPGRYLYEKGMTVHKALSLAGGLTEKAEKATMKLTRITGGLAETIAVTPDAAVQPDDILVAEPQTHKFYVSGEVKTPGVYSYSDGLSVQKAIAMAGGLTEHAERGEFGMMRYTGGQEETLRVKLKTTVRPDDIIVVGEGQRFYISGEVKTAGRYLYEKGITVNKALSFAGGPTERGEKGPIKVTRIADGLAQTMVVTRDAAILPDDIIVVEPQNQKFYTSGEVRNPGGYPYKEGLTVHQALSLAGGLTEKAGRGDLRVLRTSKGQEETFPVKWDTLILPDDIIVVAEGQRFYISGEVKTAGRYLYEKGLTVHKAISMAGGFTERAQHGIIKATRITDGVAATNVISAESFVLPDDIIVVEPQNHKFYTSGEVKNAGGYPYKEGLTVHQALSLAGGLTEKAERSDFQVLRPTKGQEQRLRVKLDTLVLPEDIIVVAEAQRFYASGEIKTPGRYLYEKGLTIHKAISMAGGATEKAETREIRVTRVISGQPETIAVNLAAPVLPDDFIIVDRLQKVYVNGEVKKPGDYPYEKNITLHKVITMAGGFTDKASESRTKVLRVIDGHEQSVRLKLEDVVLPEDIIVVPRSFF